MAFPKEVQQAFMKDAKALRQLRWYEQQFEDGFGRARVLDGLPGRGQQLQLLGPDCTDTGPCPGVLITCKPEGCEVSVGG